MSNEHNPPPAPASTWSCWKDTADEHTDASVLPPKYDHYLRWMLPNRTWALNRSIDMGVRPVGSALTTSNLHRPCGFGRNDAVFGVAPCRNE